VTAETASSPSLLLPPIPRDPLAAFVREHEPALQAVARRLCGNPHDAGDLVQDTLERAIAGFARLPPGARHRSWVMTILRNTFIDRCRRAAARGRHDELDDEVMPASLAEPVEPAWVGIDPDRVRAAIGQLGDDFRIVVEMHLVERRSYEEIAAALGIPKATVGTRLLRARKKLRALLAADVPRGRIEARGARC